MSVWTGNRQPGADRQKNSRWLFCKIYGGRERPAARQKPCNLETAGKTATIQIIYLVMISTEVPGKVRRKPGRRKKKAEPRAERMTEKRRELTGNRRGLFQMAFDMGKL